MPCLRRLAMAGALLLLVSCMTKPTLTVKSAGITQGVTVKAPVVNTVALSPDGGQVLTGSSNAFTLWDLRQGRKVDTFSHLQGYSGDSAAVAFSARGTYFASGGAGLRLYDATTRRPLRNFGADRTTSIAFSADEQYILTGNYLVRMQLWNTTSGALVREFRQSLLSATALSPDGRYALCGTRTGNMILWDCTTGVQLKKVKADHGPTFPPLAEVRSLAFSADGKFALSGGYDNTMRLWSIPACEELRAFKGHTGMGGISCVAFAPDGRTAWSAGYENRIIAWNLDTGEQLRSLTGHTGMFGVALQPTPDGRFLVSAGDASTRVWDAATGEPVATMVGFEDGEWITTTANGYFRSSAKGAEYLTVSVDGRTYSTEQLRESFFRPDLVGAALAGGSLKDMRRIADVKPPPAVTILEWPKRIESGEAALTLKVVDGGGGIGDVRLYLNGSAVLLDNVRGLDVRPSDPGGLVKSYKLKCAPGQNTVRAVAFNADNTMQSAEAVCEIVAAFAPSSKPTLHALVIGINEYRNPKLLLNFAVADATLFADTLRTVAAPLFAAAEIKVLTTPAETTRDNILRELKAMQAMNPEDIFVLYMASHGTVDDGEYYLITSNVGSTRIERLRTDAIGQSMFKDLLGNIPATKKLVVIDTCSAGALGEAIQVAMLTRGMSEDTAMKILSRAVGSTILSAATSAQEALEGYQGHGLFTFVLAEGLKGKADKSRTGFVKTTELADYVDGEVPLLAERIFKKAQYPTISISGQAFPIGKVDGTP